MGPRTGRTAGFCAGYDVPGYMNPAAGRFGGFGGGRFGGRGMGFRRGWGGGGAGGRGWGWQPYNMTTDTGSEEVRAEAPAFRELLDSVNKLREEVADMNKRISELERS